MSLACNPTNLRNLSRCFSCFTPNQLREIQTYLDCQWFNNKTPTPPPTPPLFNIFTTPLVTIGTGMNTFNHPLGVTPQIVRPVLVCTANDAASGYSAGDEIDIGMLTWSSFGGQSVIGVYVNSATVSVQTNEFRNGATWVVWNKGANNTASSVSSSANFAVKVYCLVGNTISPFTAGPITQNTGATNFNHGLGAVPNLVYSSVLVVGNDAQVNAPIGDEMPADFYFKQTPPAPISLCLQNSTQVTLVSDALRVGQEANNVAWNFNVNDSAINGVSMANFKTKAYAFSVPGMTTNTFSNAAGIQSFAHGFSKTPQLVIPVIRMTVNDANFDYSLNDEVPLKMWGCPTNRPQIAMVGANASTIFLNTAQFFAGNEGQCHTWKKITDFALQSPLNWGNWSLVVYALAI
jgi:hypothetical protein